jgi:hypothetical protein
MEVCVPTADITSLCPAHIPICRGVEVLALRSELTHQLAQFLQAAFGRADRDALLAIRIGAWLARIQPVLDRTGDKAVGNVPYVGFIIRVRDFVTEVDGFAEGFAEGVIGFLHDRSARE